MEKFNKLVGLIFGKLYEEFPVPVELTPETFLNQIIGEDDGEGSFNFDDYFGSTIKWLETADYIWIEQDDSSFDGPIFAVVLSERGLESLRKVPDSLEGSASIGERLVSFSKSKASE